MFQRVQLPACEDAMDANDDGALDVSDVVYILRHLFEARVSLPFPGGYIAGYDLTADELFCEDR